MAKVIERVAGFFEGIEGAEQRSGGSYLRPGNCDAKLVECKAITTRAKRAAFVVELEIVESRGGDNAVGSRRSWMVMMDSDSALSDVRGFAAAATGVQFSAVDGAAMERVVSPEQPLRNRLVRFVAENIETKKGATFTRVQWEAHPEQAPMGAKGTATTKRG